jgi:hypothetical protein
LFVTSSDEIQEWWFRWSLDRYRLVLHIDFPSPIGRIINFSFFFILFLIFMMGVSSSHSNCYGMIVGLLYRNAPKFGLIDDSSHQHLLSWTRIRFLVLAAALLELGGCMVTGYSKPKCNEVHQKSSWEILIYFLFCLNK